MLSTKSFPISDESGINAVLSTTRMAAKAQILVSDGRILLPVEDLSEPTGEHLAAAHAETLTDLLFAQEYTTHDLAVLNAHIERMDTERMQKEIIEKKKDWEALGKKIEEFRGMAKMKEADLAQYALEISMRRDRIAFLLAK